MFTHHYDYKDEIILFEIGFFQDCSSSFCVNVLPPTNKVRKLIAVKVLHNLLLITTMVTFKVLPLGSYAPMPVPSPTFKKFWKWFCGMAFRAAVVLFLMSSVSSKCLPFNISFIFGNRKKSVGARSGE